MSCESTQILLHGLIDGELDAGHAREVEAHAASCPRCGASLRDYRRLRQAISRESLRHAAPEHLRRRVAAALQRPNARPQQRTLTTVRSSMLKGFGM
jgi:anti-sigma factor RsiW